MLPQRAGFVAVCASSALFGCASVVIQDCASASVCDVPAVGNWRLRYFLPPQPPYLGLIWFDEIFTHFLCTFCYAVQLTARPCSKRLRWSSPHSHSMLQRVVRSLVEEVLLEGSAGSGSVLAVYMQYICTIISSHSFALLYMII